VLGPSYPSCKPPPYLRARALVLRRCRLPRGLIRAFGEIFVDSRLESGAADLGAWLRDKIGSWGHFVIEGGTSQVIEIGEFLFRLWAHSLSEKQLNSC
jgi:hypothetical protein